MKTSLVAGAMLLALTVAAPRASASSCAAPSGVWGPFTPLAHSQNELAATGTLDIVAFGSSSTSGTGASTPEHSYPAQLAALLQERFPEDRIKVFNAGVHGDTVAMNLARLERDVLARQPDLVIWQVGTNDALQKKNLTDVYGALLGGIARMKQAGAEVVLMDAQFFPERPDTDMLRASRAIGSWSIPASASARRRRIILPSCGGFRCIMGLAARSFWASRASGSSARSAGRRIPPTDRRERWR